MKTELTAQQITSYQENGFIAIPGLLTPTEVAHWSEVTEAAVNDRLKSGNLHNQNDAEDFYAQVFTQALRLADTSPAMRELIYSPALAQMAATLAGVDGIRAWHDQALFKPPFGNPTAYHLDNPYWSFHSKNSISIWIALDDATLENGCMWYLPGTQKTATTENSGIGMNIAGLFKVYPQWKKIAPVPVPAKAGTAVFHNGLTAHGAGANMTNRPRRAMTLAYMPDGSTFNGVRNILTESYFKSLKIGDVLQDETQNPLLWSRH